MPEWLWPFVIVIFAACIASIGLLYRRMSRAENELIELRTKVGPYWEVIQKVLSERLTHHGEPETDELMVQLNAGSLTPAGAIKLKQHMKDRAVDMRYPPNERETASHFGWIMDQVIVAAEKKK